MSADAVSSAELLERALTAARSDECVVLLTETTQANLRWAHSTLTTNGQMHDRRVTVIAIQRTGQEAAVGVVMRRVNSAADVTGAVAAAEQAAAAAPASEDAMPLVEATTDPDFTDPAVPTSIAVFTELAAGLGEVFAQARDEDIALFGFAEHTLSTTWVGTTSGVRRRHVQPTGRLELNAKDLSMQRTAWVGRATADFTDIDVGQVWSELRQRYGWTARQIELPAGRYETVLPPSAVADLMIYAHWTSGWRDAAEGRSVFSGRNGGTRLGERLAALPLSLWSDPEYPGLETAPFVTATASGEGITSVFDNGLALQRETWLDQGTLTELQATRAVGVASGRGQHTAADNLIMDAGSSTSLDEMVASTERGLLLTCLWYIREVDPQTLLVTGLTRDGVHLIEGGEITGSVNNFRFNESPVDLLSRATEASATSKVLPREWNDWYSRCAMPALRVGDFTMSTVSRAR